MNFDSFLNAIIPWIIIVVFAFLLYKPLKEPISELFKLIREMIGWGKNKINPKDEEGEFSDVYKGIDYS